MKRLSEVKHGSQRCYSFGISSEVKPKANTGAAELSVGRKIVQMVSVRQMCSDTRAGSGVYAQ